MPSGEDYKTKAHNCLDIAEQTTDAVTGSLLRMLAADYFELTEQEASQRQQQIQPKAPEPNDK